MPEYSVSAKDGDRYQVTQFLKWFTQPDGTKVLKQMIERDLPSNDFPKWEWVKIETVDEPEDN